MLLTDIGPLRIYDGALKVDRRGDTAIELHAVAKLKKTLEDLLGCLVRCPWLRPSTSGA